MLLRRVVGLSIPQGVLILLPAIITDHDVAFPEEVCMQRSLWDMQRLCWLMTCITITRGAFIALLLGGI